MRTALGEQSECCFLLVAGSLSLRVAIWDSGASSGIDRRGTCWTEFISGLVCGIAAFDDKVCSDIFGLDKDEEFIIYTAPVGTISSADIEKEKGFYRFVEEEGL